MDLYLSRDYGGGVNSGSNNGVIVDTVANTVVLPRSIMLYAVDEYLVPDSRGSPSITYHTITVNSRRYLYNAFFIFVILFTARSEYTPVLTFHICNYDSDNALILNQSNLSPSYVSIVQSTTNTFLFIPPTPRSSRPYFSLLSAYTQR